MISISNRAIVLRFALLALSCSMFASCAAPPMDVKAMVTEWANYMQSDYVLRPDDEIVVSVQPAELEPQTLVVPPTGQVNLARVADSITAIGKPIRVFRAEVQSAYRKVFQDAVQVQVSLLRASASSIYVTGEVRSPGAVPYTPAMTLSQAVAAAGGLQITAKLTDVRVLRSRLLAEPRTFRINLDAIMHNESGMPDFLLLPGDVVYCQTLWIVDVTNTLRTYLWNLTPLGQDPTTFARGF